LVCRVDCFHSEVTGSTSWHACVIKGSLAGSLEGLEGWETQLSLKVCKVVQVQGQHAQPEMQRQQVEAGEGSSQESSVSGCASLRPSSKPSYLASVIVMAVSRCWVKRLAEQQASAVVMIQEYMGLSLEPPLADPLCYWASKSEI
ncbi:hypothetical protein JRQ81_003125, partial [Phrynocephalus forsythii]